jgi:hypothetical protein
MKTSRKAAWSAAILVGIAATLISVPASQAAAKACPQWAKDYCVVDKTGFRHTAQTNPCLAKKDGLRILHAGACLGPICPFDGPQVCSRNPDTHKRQTYNNLCLSDVANATLIHKGACK